MGARKNWTEEQIIGILKQVEAGRTVAEVCRERVPPGRRVGESTYYKWKSKYGGLEVNESRRLKALEDENSRLKRLLAGRPLGGPCSIMLRSRMGCQKTGEARCSATGRDALHAEVSTVAAAGV